MNIKEGLVSPKHMDELITELIHVLRDNPPTPDPNQIVPVRGYALTIILGALRKLPVSEVTAAANKFLDDPSTVTSMFTE